MRRRAWSGFHAPSEPRTPALIANEVTSFVFAAFAKSMTALHSLRVRCFGSLWVEPPAVAHAWGDPTDLAFVDLAYALHRAGATVSLATHDPVLREALLPALPGAGVEMLLGVRPDDQVALAARGVAVRVYMPYGDGWFRYAMRRLAESRGVH